MNYTSSVLIEKYSDANIEPFREVGDLLADKAYLVLKKLEFNSTQAEPLDFMQQVLNTDIDSSDKSILQNFINHVNKPPSWVDFDRIERGRHVYLRFAPLSTLVLFLAGLVGSYTASYGVKVLIRTGRLKSDILPRLFETSQFIINVLERDGLRVGNIGHATCIRVRLMHAAIRINILHSKQSWEKEYGHPINQEDMCGTLTLFSYVVLKGLENLGVYFSTQDKEDYIHLWRTVGYLLGCDDFFLPENYESTEAIYSAIRRRQSHPDEDSRMLVHLVIDAVARLYKDTLPKESFYAMSRFFIGDSLADQLELPMNKQVDMTMHAIVPLLSISTFFTSQLNSISSLFSKLGTFYVKDTTTKGLDGQKALFRIPGLGGL